MWPAGSQLAAAPFIKLDRRYDDTLRYVSVENSICLPRPHLRQGGEEGSRRYQTSPLSSVAPWWVTFHRRSPCVAFA